MPICLETAGCSSMFILTSFTLPVAARTTFSRIGVSCLQGPHQGAQKSISTGWRLDSSITSFTKVCVVVSLIRPSAAAVAVPASCNILFPPVAPAFETPMYRITWCPWRRLQSSSRRRRRLRDRRDAGRMAGRVKEFDQVIAPDRGGHGVAQGVIVQRGMHHHGRVDDDRDTSL